MTDIQEIVLFPLDEVLFPGGRIDLQIFERRYIDLVRHCLKSDLGFGICLERGRKKILHTKKRTLSRVGTYAYIVDWDQLDNGLLGITVEGTAKYKIKNCWEEDGGLMKAVVEFSENDSVGKQMIPFGEQYSGLADLLQSLENHPCVEQKKLNINYNNLWDLGWRLSELVPMEKGVRQELLEMDDPRERIEKIEELVSDIAYNP